MPQQTDLGCFMDHKMSQTTRVSKSRPLGALRAPSSKLTSSQTKTTHFSVGIKSQATMHYLEEWTSPI